jgi:hypothetical protein
MKTHKIFAYIGIALSIIGVAITYTLHWMLGVATTIIVIVAFLWWRNMKKEGDKYLVDFAEATGLKYIQDNVVYGRVHGDYKGHEVSLTVTSDYNSDRGLMGFVLSDVFMQSAVGVVEGIENYTVLKLKHNKVIENPYSVDKWTFVDRDVIAYFPPVGGPEGLPHISVLSLREQLDRLIKIADEL